MRRDAIRGLDWRAAVSGCAANSTGAPERTQVSLLPPPYREETTGESAEAETRVSPPGMTVKPSGVAQT